MKYDYLAEVKKDVEQWINENENEIPKQYDVENLEEYLGETLWVEDSVTGNASGSYTFNAYEAEENLNHNWDLLQEALQEFGCEENPIEKGAEWCDVTIRCYLLNIAISEVLSEIDTSKYIE